MMAMNYRMWEQPSRPKESDNPKIKVNNRSSEPRNTHRQTAQTFQNSQGKNRKRTPTFQIGLTLIQVLFVFIFWVPNIVLGHWVI